MSKTSDFYKFNEELKERKLYIESLPSQIEELEHELENISLLSDELHKDFIKNAEKVKYTDYFKSNEEIIKDLENKKKSFFNKKIYEKMIKDLKEDEEKKKEISDYYIKINSLKKDLDESKNRDDSVTLDDGVLSVSEKKEKDLMKLDLNIIPQDKLYLVHCTDFFPHNKIILNNHDGNKEFGFKNEITDNCYVVKKYTSNRETVHFTVNCRVESTADGRGEWNQPSYIIIEPYEYHKNEFVGNTISAGDNYIEKSVKLSDDAILMVREDLYSELSDEELKSYNIVKYKGDASKCLENFFYNIGVPVITNQTQDAGHSRSLQFYLENVLNSRNVWINLLQNTLPENTFVFLSEDEVAILYQNLDLKYLSSYVKREEIKKLSSKYNVSDELALFVLGTGVVKLSNGKYSVLDYKEIRKHLNDADYYIDKIDSTGIGLGQLQDTINSFSIENYCINNRNPNGFDTLTVGNLQVLKNLDIMIQLKEKLNMNDDTVLILRDDGLYISPKLENDENKDTYVEKGNFDIKIGDNITTLNEVINNYKMIINNSNQYYNDFIESEENHEEIKTK